MDLIPVAFLNHENTKKLEFHEIFQSRISRIHWDSPEKHFNDFIPCIDHFSCFSFSFRGFVIQT